MPWTLLLSAVATHPLWLLSTWNVAFPCSYEL